MVEVLSRFELGVTGNGVEVVSRSAFEKVMESFWGMHELQYIFKGSDGILGLAIA